MIVHILKRQFQFLGGFRGNPNGADDNCIQLMGPELTETAEETE